MTDAPQHVRPWQIVTAPAGSFRTVREDGVVRARGIRYAEAQRFAAPTPFAYPQTTPQQPFTADSPIQIAFRNVHEDVPLPSKLVPDMPADVDELVATMTRREPQDRPADADEALALLRNVVDELTDSELSVRRGDGTGTLRTQQVMTANAQAARSAIDNEPQDDADDSSAEDASPHAGMRTVSLPIGSIGPDSKGRTRALSRKALAAEGLFDADRKRPIPYLPDVIAVVMGQ